MNQKVVYNNLLNTIIYQIRPKLDNSINTINQVLGYMADTITINGTMLKREQLQNINNNLVNYKKYLNNSLIPYLRSKMAEVVS